MRISDWSSDVCSSDLKMNLNDFLWWLTALFGGLMICGAKLAYMLFGLPTEPPIDPSALASWERKRRWMVISELAALPAFAAIAVIVGKLQHWPIEAVVALSMVDRKSVVSGKGWSVLVDPGGR